MINDLIKTLLLIHFSHGFDEVYECSNDTTDIEEDGGDTKLIASYILI